MSDKTTSMESGGVVLLLFPLPAYRRSRLLPPRLPPPRFFQRLSSSSLSLPRSCT